MGTFQNKTVGEIAIENPTSLRVFESLGIDYCCGGNRSLSEACSRANIPVDRVLTLLSNAVHEAQPAGQPDWTRATLGALITHIVDKHHAFVRAELPRIDTLLAKVVTRHGEVHPETQQIRQLFAALAHELSMHMMKEEQVLFPVIAQMERARLDRRPFPPPFFGSVTRPIATMLAEHDDAGALLQNIRELSNRYTLPEGACATYRALYQALEGFERDLHQHIHLENNLLFPRAAEMEAAN